MVSCSKVVLCCLTAQKKSPQMSSFKLWKPGLRFRGSLDMEITQSFSESGFWRHN